MGFLTTESFVIELSKYARISKYCNSEKISNCWPYKEVELVDGTKYDMSRAGESDVFITEDNLNPDEYIYANDNVSFVTDNGTAVLINYNTRCNPEANDENNTCYMALMDVNGDKTPNKVGEDIFLINAKGFVVSEKLETCGVNQCPKPPSQL